MDNAIVRDIALASFPPETEVVFGRDDRVRVSNVRSAPWNRICALRIGGPSGELFAGSGWILGPYTIATAGHCVFLRELGRWASYVDVRVEQSNGVPSRILRSRTFRSTANWIGNSGPQYDLGLILVDEPIGDDLGSFSFGSYSNQQLVGASTTIAGYPADRDAGRNQYRDRQPILAVDASALRYRIDTFEGQSGAPVWLDVDGSPVVVGVHVSGALGTNAAVRINEDVMALLRSWKKLRPERVSGTSKIETASTKRDWEGSMSIVEQGNQTKNGKRTNGAPAPKQETIVSEAPATAGVIAEDIVGVIAQLAAVESSLDERLKVQALIIGSMLVMPKQATVESDLPVLFEYMRSGRAKGSEWLFLTLLSAASTTSPGLARQYASLAGLISLKSTSEGKDFFCDMSSTNVALVTTVARKTLPAIFARLRNEMDVGILVRTTGGLATISSEERSMSDPWSDEEGGSGGGGGGGGGFGGGMNMDPMMIDGDPMGPQRRYDACVDRFTAIGAIAGGATGLFSPVGPSAGAGIGGAVGRAVGRYVCQTASGRGEEAANIKRENAVLPGAAGDGFVPLPELLPGGVLPIRPRLPIPIMPPPWLQPRPMPGGVYPPWYWAVDPIPPWTRPTIYPEPRPMGPTFETPPIVRPVAPELESAVISASDFGTERTLTVERLCEETYLLHIK